MTLTIGRCRAPLLKNIITFAFWDMAKGITVFIKFNKNQGITKKEITMERLE